MAIYELKQPGGRSFKVNFDREMTQQDADEILAQDAAEGVSKLAAFTGKKKSRREERAELKENISQALGIDSSQFNENEGADTITRGLVDFLPTQEEKVAALQKKYGESNVRPLRIGGDDRIVFRADDGKFRLFDEQGFSLKDITSDIAGEVIPTATSIAAGLSAGAATIGSGGLVAPLAIGAAGGVTQGSVGFLQDIAVRAIAGEEQQFGESAKRAAGEALFTGVVDATTAGTGRFISRLWGDRVVGQSAERISTLMKKYDVDMQLPASVRGTEDEVLSSLKRTANLPKGAEARKLGNVRDSISKEVDDLRSLYGGSAEDMVRYVRGVQQRADELTQKALADDLAADRAVRALDEAKGRAGIQIEKQQAKLAKQQTADRLKKAKIMRDEIDANLEKIVGKRISSAKHGEDLRLLRLEGQRLAEKRSGELYKEAYRRANVMNAETNADEITTMISKALQDAGYELDENGMISGKVMQTMKDTFGDKLGRIHNSILYRLQTRTENLQFSELDEYVRAMGRAVPWNKLSKKVSSPDERAFRSFYEKMVKLRDKKLKSAGVPAQRKYQQAVKDYKTNVRPYVDDPNLFAAGEEITQGTGQYKQPPEQVLSRALGSNQAAERMIARSSSPDATRKILQEAWLEKKLPRQVGEKRQQISLSTDDIQMMKTLFGTGKDGWTQPRANINALNRLITKYGNAGNDALSKMDKAKFIQAKTKAEQRAIEKATAKKMASAKERDEYLKDNLVKMILNNEIDVNADVAVLAGKILDSAKTPSDITKIMSKMTPEARESFRRSAFDNLLTRSGWDSATAQRSVVGDKPLWQPGKMQSILRRGPNKADGSLGDPATNEGKKFLAALGDEGFEKMELYNELLGRAAKVTKDNEASLGRAVLSSGQSGVPKILIVSAAPFTFIGRRLMGILHSSDMLEPFIRSFTNPKEINQTAFKNSMMVLFGTQKGIRALRAESERDSEFANWVSQYYNQVYIPESGQAQKRGAE